MADFLNRPFKKVNTENSLQDLPTEILYTIFSYLDQKSAMKMSAVCKDFYDFWAKSEVLAIKIKDMEPILLDLDRGNKLRVMFEKNILDMLHRRKNYGVPLTRCTIALHSLVSSRFVTEVLHTVVDSNVKHLHVQAFTGFFTPCARFPSSINCSSLTTLCIKDVYGESFELPKSVILPNLKVLRLHDFEFSTDNYNGAIFEGCPNLQKLVIVKCRMKPEDNLRNFHVKSLKLKKLVFKSWRIHWDCYNQSIHVNAPELVCFKFKGNLPIFKFGDGNLLHLERACFDLSDLNSDRMMLTSERLLNILYEMRHVKFVSSSTNTKKVIANFHVLGDPGTLVSNNLEVLKWKVQECIKRFQDLVKDESEAN